MKITIIGTGHVGSSVAFALLNKCKWHGKLVLIDKNNEKLYGEYLDLCHAGKLLNPYVNLVYHDRINQLIQGSLYVIICAGVPRENGQSMDDIYPVNAPVIERICRDMLHYAPNSRIIMVTNPADRMQEIAERYYKHVYIPDNKLDHYRYMHYVDLKKVKQAGSEIIKFKGWTNWGVAAVVADMIGW